MAFAKNVTQFQKQITTITKLNAGHGMQATETTSLLRNYNCMHIVCNKIINTEYLTYHSIFIKIFFIHC